MIKKSGKLSKISGKKRPVVIITMPLWPPYVGGGVVYFDTLVGHLKKKVDFIILTQHYSGRKNIEKQKNVWVYRIQPYIQFQPFVLKYLIIPPLTFLSLLYFWIKYKPIIHTHSSGVYGFTPSLFSSILKDKMIKDVMDLADPGFNLRTGEVNTYVAQGNSIRKKLIAAGIPEERILTIPVLNPPDFEVLAKTMKAKPKKDNKTKLLFVGYLNPYKAPDVLLKAFNIVEKKRKDIILNMIGDGTERKWCEDFIKKNKLKNVHLLGTFKDIKKVLEYMANTDIMLLPSRPGGESWGRVICEGYMFKKPVIGTNIDGIKNVVTPGYNGILVPNEDYEALAKEIIRLVDDKKLQKTMGENGKRFLESLSTWEELAEDVYQEYLKIWNTKD